MQDYESHTCGICKMSIDLSCEEYITINVQVQDKIYVPMKICEAHSHIILNKSHKLLVEAFSNHFKYYY